MTMMTMEFVEFSFLIGLFSPEKQYKLDLTNTAAAFLPQPGETVVTIFTACTIVFRAFHLTLAALRQQTFADLAGAE